jgi:hypothetical protein
MFNEPNKATNNHFFYREADNYNSRLATEQELVSMREDSKKGEWMTIGRSCWECNGAHLHLIDAPNMNCYSCGRFYHRGYDITVYD